MKDFFKYMLPWRSVKNAGESVARAGKTIVQAAKDLRAAAEEAKRKREAAEAAAAAAAAAADTAEDRYRAIAEATALTEPVRIQQLRRRRQGKFAWIFCAALCVGAIIMSFFIKHQLIAKLQFFAGLAGFFVCMFRASFDAYVENMLREQKTNNYFRFIFQPGFFKKVFM